MESFRWPPRPEGHTPDKTGRPDEPWLTRDAITRLEGIVGFTTVVLEFGSGASTIWFAKRSARVESIEHDGDWHRRVVEAARYENVTTAFLYHVPSDGNFSMYIEKGREIAERLAPGLLVVDGRCRVRCIKAVAPLMPVGAHIVLDNAERPRYEEAHNLLAESWLVEQTTNGLWRTDIFTRKESR